MSDDFVDKLEGLIHEHRQESAIKERDEANEARFKTLEEKFDKLGNLIDERIPAKSSAAANSEAGAEEKGEDSSSIASDDPPLTTPETTPELQVERIKKLSVPRFYTGDDEPDTIQYIDADTGETMTRKGRKKNRPTNYDVEIVIDEPNIDRPQEPDEEAV